MSEEGFIARWARRKAAARARAEDAPSESPRPPATAPEAESTAAQAASLDDEAGGETAVDPASLPPIESLTAQSDFKAFLQQGVPEELRRAALRKLWRSDPTLAAPEVLDLHNLDYTLPAVPEAVRTAYKVGKGFLDAIEEGKEKESKVPPEPGTPAAAAGEQGKDPPAEKS